LFILFRTSLKRAAKILWKVKRFHLEFKRRLILQIILKPYNQLRKCLRAYLVIVGWRQCIWIFSIVKHFKYAQLYFIDIMISIHYEIKF
jgi:hypothetical protein